MQTKIEAVREELQRMLAKDPAAKALIFSQFTSMLDLVAFRLDQARCPSESCREPDEICCLRW